MQSQSNATALHEVQRELEKESQSLGQVRYAKFRDQQGEAASAPGRRLVMDSVNAVAEGIMEFLREADTGKPGKRHSAVKWLRHLDPHALAYLTAVAATNALTLRGRASRFTVVASQVGNAVAREAAYAAFKDQHPGLHKVIQGQIKKSTSARHSQAVMNRAMSKAEMQNVELDDADAVMIGSVLLDAFIGRTGLLETVTKVSHRGKTVTRELHIAGTDKTMEWLEKAHDSAALFQPVLLPMVVTPRPWTSPTDGGFLTLKGKGTHLVRTRNSAYRNELALVDMPMVYGAVNAIQSTPWKINKHVLEVMQDVWQMGGGFAGLPDRELIPLPNRPAADEDMELFKVEHPEAFKDWKKRTAAVYEANATGTSKRVMAAQKLTLANKFKDFEAIYFPHNLDFRGRVYPMVPTLSPQGDDQAKALLTFSKGVALGEGGGFWLAVHLANTFGVDKVSFEDRVQWVLDNEEMILDCAMSPLDGQRGWMKADSPFCALAACFEWMGFKHQGDEWVSHLPIALDGSCNGLQNFSAMLRDPVGGKATNLVPQEIPADIYTKVRDVAQLRIRKDAEEGNPLALPLDGNLTRNICKQPVMTLPYGVTKSGMKDQVCGALEEAGLPCDWATGAYLVNHLWEAIREVVVAARAAMDWLQQATKIAAKAGLPLSWTTPAGFPVLQDYRAELGKRVRPHVGGRELNLVVNITGTKLDAKRQVLGISPNFIHSCDASHMMLTVNGADAAGIESFAMIHDSFGTHAGNTEILATALRQTFVDQYSGNVLQQFLDELHRQLPADIVADLPELPPMGTLDLNLVLDSAYFFA